MKKENEDERLSFDVLLKLAKGDFSVMDEVYNVYEKRFRKYAVNQGIEWKVNFNELKVDEAISEMIIRYIKSLGTCKLLEELRSKMD